MKISEKIISHISRYASTPCAVEFTNNIDDIYVGITESIAMSGVTAVIAFSWVCRVHVVRSYGSVNYRPISNPIENNFRLQLNVRNVRPIRRPFFNSIPSERLILTSSIAGEVIILSLNEDDIVRVKKTISDP